MMFQDLAEKILGSWLGKLLVGASAFLLSARYTGGIYAYLAAEKCERPAYAVVDRLPGGVEIRQYEPYMIAEITADDDSSGFQEAGKQTFGKLAGYIFGRNKAYRGGGSQKMAMTAPVRFDGGQNKKTRVSFVIGSEYTMKTVPKPLERKLKLRQVPAHTLAVKKFSGKPPSDKRIQKEREILYSALSKADVPFQEKDRTTLVYGYHDPVITPNVLRRNEVAVVVKGNV